jgi:hypothetical protein
MGKTAAATWKFQKIPRLMMVANAHQWNEVGRASYERHVGIAPPCRHHFNQEHGRRFTEGARDASTQDSQSMRATVARQGLDTDMAGGSAAHPVVGKQESPQAIQDS